MHVLIIILLTLLALILVLFLGLLVVQLVIARKAFKLVKTSRAQATSMLQHNQSVREAAENLAQKIAADQK